MQYLLTKDELDSLNGEKKLRSAIDAFYKAVSSYSTSMVEAAKDSSWDDGKRFKETFSRAVKAGHEAALASLSIN